MRRMSLLDPSRRDFLKVGTLAPFGLGLTDFIRAQRLGAAAANPHGGTAKACIIIWLDGGPSHLETFDPKPDAPLEIRGPMASIATSLPGVRIGECLEQTAKIIDRFALVRSVTSPLGEHNFASHYMLTGYPPTPALEYPTLGSAIAFLRPGTSELPSNIAIPRFTDNVSGNGFLPASTAPFSLGGNPEKPDFRVDDLHLFEGLDLQRLARRRDMLRSLNEANHANDINRRESDSDLDRAYELVASTDAKAAFRLEEESDAMRNRYGRGGAEGIGPSCLLARRLVERGVPFVTVHSGGWDTHQNIVNLKSRFPNDRGAHLPSLDRALSALVSDLESRGMLEQTLVCVMGEFGRTPKINSAAGRDHWPNVYSVAMAGGGVRGGQVIGQSDSLAEFPHERPVTPSDLAATIYRLLGINPSQEVRTSDGRPVRIAADEARVIGELTG